MGYVTLLVSGVPTYVTLYDLFYHLECLFTTNSEIGAFEVRRLPHVNNKPLIALDFHSGFDAIAAQEQLHDYQYEMQDGTQYVLQAKITNKKEYLRGDSDAVEWPIMGNDACSALAIPIISDAAIFRANSKLDAQYRLLKKQKLIVQAEMELIKERRKLRKEYAQGEFSDSDNEPNCSSRISRSRSTSREHRSFSQELEIYKRKAAKIKELKAIDCHAKESASNFKRRSPQWEWDIEAANQPRSLEIKSTRSSRERSLRKYSFKSRVRSRAVRSRSLSSPDRSRSRTSSPKTLRSRSQSRRSSHKRSSSRDAKSRERSCKRTSRKRERSRHRISGSKRLRSPESDSRSRIRHRSPRLLAIKAKSPVKRETYISRSIVDDSDDSDIEIKITKRRTKRDNYSPKHTANDKCKDLRRFINIKSKTGLKNNCTITSVTTNAIENNLINQTSKLEDNKNMGSKNSIKNTNEKVLKDTPKKIDSTDKKKDLKNNPMKTKKESIHKKAMISEETKIRLICDDIMFLMKSLLLEISIKDNIIISDSTNKLITEKLNILVQERVKILYADENFTVSKASEIYRKVCTKEDDTLLLKRMLNEIKTRGSGTSETGNQNISEKSAKCNDSAKNSIREISNVELATVMHGGKEEYELKNECSIQNKQNTKQTNVDKDKGNKTTEVIEVIDLETYCPKESSIKAPEKVRTLSDRPQFVIVVKKLMKELKPVLWKSRGKGVYVNYFYMKEVLRILLADILKGKGYKRSSEIIALFRRMYPRCNDEEFVKQIAEDIKMNKYDLDGVGEVFQDDTDVMLIENEPEVVTIEDSDDESDEIRKEIIAVISSLDESTESQKTNGAFNSLSEGVKEAVNSIIEPNESEKKMQPDNRSVEINENSNTNDTLSYILDLIKSEKINEADKSDTEVKEICNTIVKREEHLLDETETKIQRTGTESGHINKDRRDQPLKVTAITIVTSESELHSIAHGVENKDEDPKQELKEEIDPELTDAEIDKILGLEDFDLDINFDEYIHQTSNVFQQETPQEDFCLDIDLIGQNTSDACEKETPQVTAITIMTSASELLAKLDGNENTIKEVPEVKVETNEDVDNGTAVPVQFDKFIENQALGDANESVGNVKNEEMAHPESHEEEETIESICKYVIYLCNNGH